MLILEAAVTGFGWERRHEFALRSRGYFSCMGRRIGIGQKGKWSRSSGIVAGYTILIEKRRYVV